MDIWMQALSEFGFPMTITFYLLYRMEKKLDLINDSIIQLQIHPESYPAGSTASGMKPVSGSGGKY
ncbi:YvrJ family protein [Alkalicoccus halolimnae]|uniref:YvrJ family protein n=1 Tax=Alkalicoccus halolimnae TaxID=1667239 RepID=A0A5C7FHW3_9BACI|nr:YvrJ family protein [Alkalicoccus halolimnae]TXF85874.1 YvrJ family protein [Alkalicoccus halolimnae]